MVFRMSRTKMESEEENQTLRFKVEELEYEINRLRSRLLNNTNLSHLNESGNRTFNKVVVELVRVFRGVRGRG